MAGYAGLDEKTKEELWIYARTCRKSKKGSGGTLDFGTAGLRGIMRAGPNGMNVYTVRQTTQPCATLLFVLGAESAGRGIAIA